MIRGYDEQLFDDFFEEKMEKPDELLIEHIMSNLQRDVHLLAESRRQKKYSTAAEMASKMSRNLALVSEYLKCR